LPLRRGQCCGNEEGLGKGGPAVMCLCGRVGVSTCRRVDAQGLLRRFSKRQQQTKYNFASHSHFSSILRFLMVFRRRTTAGAYNSCASKDMGGGRSMRSRAAHHHTTQPNKNHDKTRTMSHTQTRQGPSRHKGEGGSIRVEASTTRSHQPLMIASEPTLDFTYTCQMFVTKRKK
jgi:hypothetical protein